MKMPRSFRVAAKKARNIVNPFASIESALSKSLEKTTDELGFNSEISSDLQQSIKKTCYESGLSMPEN